MKIIKAIKERKAFFDDCETTKARYTLSCAQCRTENLIFVFKEILDAAWGWREITKNDERQAIAITFGIDLDDKSIGNGMDAVVTKICTGCGQKHYVFFWFHEHRNSCYEISLRGVAIQNT